MSQVGFQRVGDERPWSRELATAGAVLLTRTPTTINWTTGDPDIIPDHVAVVLWGGTDFPDPDSGMVYILFTTQGSALWYAATIDNAQAMDTLVGADTVWGIAFWWDGNGEPEDWIQY